MYGFTRSLPFLRFLFPPSQQPADLPGFLEENVRFTQDYFGGGYGQKEVVNCFSQATITKAADNTRVLVSAMPANQITRVLAISIRNTTAPQVVPLSVRLEIYALPALAGTGVAASALTIITAGAPTQERFAFNNVPPIFMQEPFNFGVHFLSGDNVDYVIEAYSLSVPRGTVFYL